MNAGFKKVIETSYGKSNNALLSRLDINAVQRERCSLCVEVYK